MLGDVSRKYVAATENQDEYCTRMVFPISRVPHRLSHHFINSLTKVIVLVSERNIQSFSILLSVDVT